MWTVCDLSALPAVSLCLSLSLPRSADRSENTVWYTSTYCTVQYSIAYGRSDRLDFRKRVAHQLFFSDAVGSDRPF